MAQNLSEAERLMAEMSAKYGVSSKPVEQPIQAPKQVAPQPPQQPQQRGLVGNAMDLFSGRKAQIDKASGYACGGKIKAHAQGGKISGPGTPTSDSIPAEVSNTGEPILVSNGERIVSAKQDAALSRIAEMLGYASVDAMFEKMTGEPVGPTMKNGKRAARYGANGEWIPDLKDDKAPAGGQWATPNMPIPTPVAGERDPMKISNPVLSLSNAADKGLTAIGNVFADSAAANREGTDYATARANRLAGSQASGSNTTQPTNPLVSGLQSELPNTNYGNEGRSVPKEITKSNPGIVSAQGSRPAITNDSVKERYAKDGGLANMKSGQYYSEIDLAGQNDRMAKSLGYASADDFNKQKANAPAGGVAVLGEVAPGISRDDVENAFGRLGSPQQQAKIAMLLGQGNKQGELGVARYGHDVTAQRAAGHDQAIMRGQDMQYGNPLDQQVKQLGVDQAKKVATLHEKAAAGDANALNELRIRGALKAEQPEYMANVVGGGVNELGLPQPQRLAITDKLTGASRFADEKPAQPSDFSKADVDKALKSGASRDAVIARIIAMKKNPADFGL